MVKVDAGISMCSARCVAFGLLRDGREVQAVELSHAQGISVRIITLGATLQSLRVPDRHGALADILLGFIEPQSYLDAREYFGATIGRYAGRMANASWTFQGQRYSLDANEGRHHLHGGDSGLDTALWQLESLSGGAQAQAVLTCVSADGEGGYPGNLHVTATFSLDADSLAIDYSAHSDQPTPVSITSHGYFNLAGEGAGGDVLEHRLTVPATAFLPVDESLIPTGELRAVSATAFDFSRPRPIGQSIRQANDSQLRFGRGYDHGYVIAPDAHGQRLMARLHEPWSGRTLEIFSDAPCLQVYSGNALDGRWRGKSGQAYRQSDGVCLEPQGWPAGAGDSHPQPAPLLPGNIYSHRMKLAFSC